MPLSSAEAFRYASDAWLRVGWDVKYVYSFTWLGRPIIQLPEDMLRLQEVIYSLRPDIIIETGVAHGGGLIFYASLCRLMGKGRVIGVERELRAHNREAIEQHELHDLITIVEGDSTATSTVDEVKRLTVGAKCVLLLLDSYHSKAHVLAELNAYGPLVTRNSYVVVMDGIMEKLVGAPRSQPDWGENNPRQAAIEWVGKNPDFEFSEPPFAFNEGLVRTRVTYWPEAFLKRTRVSGLAF
jgi:cephalosporin hydroxylase